MSTDTEITPLSESDRLIRDLVIQNGLLRSALELVAMPSRPDGTYNRCREACGELARKTLENCNRPLDTEVGMG